MLGTIILSVILVTFDKINEKQYPVLVFCICLGMVYQMTLISNYIVGTDIHYEHYFALSTYNTGVWDSAVGHSYNAATSVTVLIPVLARILHIPLEWAFKVIPPLFLAGIPVISYLIFRKEFGGKVAFLSAFFLISMPTIALELSGLAKQSIGELFLIMCLGLIAYNIYNLKWARYALIGMLALLTVVSHYSMGGVLICFLIGTTVLLLAGKLVLKVMPSFALRPSINNGYLSAIFAVFMILTVLFYGWAAQGAAWLDITGSAAWLAKVPYPVEYVHIPKEIPDAIDHIAVPPDVGISPGAEQFKPDGTPVISDDNLWTWPEPAVKAAIGLDFFDVPLLPKLFRIFQFLTQLLIVIGVAAIFWRHKRHNLTYLILLALSGMMLALMVFTPGFSSLLNASRLYNLVLLFMAPAIIVGGKLILRNYKAIVIGVLIPYFIFTSGVVYELTGSTNLHSVTVPYSHALSAARTDSTGLFTDNDMAARDWVADNAAYPVYGDLWGSTAVLEKQTNLSFEVNRQMKDKLVVVLWIFEGRFNIIPNDCHILLRERNTENRELTYLLGVGLRAIRSYDEVGFDKDIADRPIVFQAGNAIVYGPKE